MKKIASFILALALILSVGATSALASKPTAKLYSGSGQHVKRGNTVKFKYKLYSGSYTKKKGQYRASFVSCCCYRSVGGKKYASKKIFFTGKYDYEFKWNVPKSVPKGKYINIYGTYYKSGSNWYMNTSKTAKFYIY